MQKTDIADNQQGNALAYLVGVYVGDGCYLENKDIFHLKSIDEDFINYVIEKFKKLNKKTRYGKTLQKQHEKAYGKKPIWCLDIYQASKFFDFENATHSKREIPIIGHKHPKSFIEGLLDSDGWFSINVHNGVIRSECGIAKCNDIMFDLIKMIHQLGIKTHKIQTKKLKSGKILKRIRFNVHSFLDSGLNFHIHRKQSRVESYRLALSATFNDYNSQTIS